MKRICIYGAGALGGTMAVKLAIGLGKEVEVYVVARGAHLEAIRDGGLKLLEADADTPLTAKIVATDDPATLPVQDLVITGLKGHQLAPAAEGLGQLLGPKTRVMMILNGIPWWYFHAEGGPFAERQLDVLDPEGRLWNVVGPERVVGCVAYQGAEVIEPGLIRLSNKGRFFIGEPSGDMSADLAEIAARLGQAGLTMLPTARIRHEIWEKLMGNACFNPISALTRALASDIVNDPRLLSLVRDVMEEVRAVANALGITFPTSTEERLANSRNIGPVRTSMLQDLLAGKPLEIDPLTGMVVEIGKLTGVPTPQTSALYALAARLDVENRRNA